MSHAVPYREPCPSCKDLQQRLFDAEDKQRKHRCWSLGKETDGSSAMDIISTVALLSAVLAFAAAAHGTTRWSVGAVLLVGAAFCRLWGISFRIW